MKGSALPAVYGLVVKSASAIRASNFAQAYPASLANNLQKRKKVKFGTSHMGSYIFPTSSKTR